MPFNKQQEPAIREQAPSEASALAPRHALRSLVRWRLRLGRSWWPVVFAFAAAGCAVAWRFATGWVASTAGAGFIVSMVLLWMVATLRPDPVLGDVDMDIAGDASSGVAEIEGKRPS
jgi:hypothetical protein